jgi:Mrp family chromosome partitioning ATPase
MMQKNSSSAPIPRDPRKLPPAQLIGMAYELAIQACRQEDEDQSVRTILMLQDAMSSVGPMDSADLLRFYGWCLDRIHKGDYHIAAETLATLRDAWEKTQ